MEATRSSSPPPARNPAVNLPEVRRFIAELCSNGQSERAIELLLELLSKLLDQNNQQAIRIAAMLRERFGRKSEKLDPHQLELFLQSLDELEKEEAEATQDDEQLEADVEKLKKLAKEQKSKQRRPGRNPLPESLPREVQRHLPPEAERTCGACGTQKREIGVETSQVLELVPAHFKVIVHERVKMACRRCEGEVTVAKAADKPVDGGLPGCGLLAHLTVSRFRDHIPVNHLSELYGRMGVRLSPSTLGSWLETVTGWLEPLHKALCALTLASHLVGSDDTGLKVLDDSHPKHIKRGHMWAYVGYDEGRPKRVVFDYAPDWEGIHPRRFLLTRRGPLQGDGYAGLEALFAGPRPACVRVGCMAHLRRYFVEALEAGDLRAAVPVKLIGRIYKVEELATLMNASVAERLALRQKHSRSLMTRLRGWLGQMSGQAEPKTPLGSACTYAINQWTSLQHFLSDGAIPIDNTEVERQLRPIARGRKAFLFAGSDEGGRRAAVLYTLMGCCVLAGVEPQAWLTEVLTRLVGGWPRRRLPELLPENWRVAQRNGVSTTTGDTDGSAAPLSPAEPPPPSLSHSPLAASPS